MKKRALITGITGQDGSYLAELLLDADYEVHGIIRRSSSFNTGRIDHIFPKLSLHFGDMTDSASLNHIIQDVRPQEIYNLAAQSHVKVSFELPEYTGNSDGLGFLRLLEVVRSVPKYDPRIYQASTSEMFGLHPAPQDENTPFRPASPYGSAKLYAHWIADNYRRSYGMHISCGILFNHESPRRGETFVSRKVTKAVAKWHHTGNLDLTLGNLKSKRDWGHAQDYVRAMYLMLQQKTPDDYVIATGKSRTVDELVDVAFGCTNAFLYFKFQTDPRYERPNEVNELCGIATKAKKKLGWEPRITFEQMIKEMVDHDIANFKG